MLIVCIFDCACDADCWMARQAVQVALRLNAEYGGRAEKRIPKPKTTKRVNVELDDSVLVFRVSLPINDGGAWRDIIVRRDTVLFDFAATIVHAFDFDFGEESPDCPRIPACAKPFGKVLRTANRGCPR